MNPTDIIRRLYSPGANFGGAYQQAPSTGASDYGMNYGAYMGPQNSMRVPGFAGTYGIGQGAMPSQMNPVASGGPNLSGLIPRQQSMRSGLEGVSKNPGMMNINPFANPDSLKPMTGAGRGIYDTMSKFQYGGGGGEPGGGMLGGIGKVAGASKLGGLGAKIGGMSTMGKVGLGLGGAGLALGGLKMLRDRRAAKRQPQQMPSPGGLQMQPPQQMGGGSGPLRRFFRR